MGRLLESNHREEYNVLYSNDIVFQVLNASLSGFYIQTGSLRLGIEEIFVNTFAAIDKTRREYTSDFFSAGNLLDGIFIGLHNESRENFEGTRDCTEKDICNAVVIIGTCAYVCLSASLLKFSAVADELDSELRKRDSQLYEDVSNALFSTLLNRDKRGAFQESLRLYLQSDEYLSDSLLAPDAVLKRRTDVDTVIGHKRRAHALLKPLSGNNKKGYKMLNDTDYNRVLKAVDHLIEKGETKKFAEKININVTQKEIGEIFYEVYSENIAGFNKMKWAEFLKETFHIFRNATVKSIAKNLSK